MSKHLRLAPTKNFTTLRLRVNQSLFVPDLDASTSDLAEMLRKYEHNIIGESKA